MVIAKRPGTRKIDLTGLHDQELLEIEGEPGLFRILMIGSSKVLAVNEKQFRPYHQTYRVVSLKDGVLELIGKRKYINPNDSLYNPCISFLRGRLHRGYADSQKEMDAIRRNVA